MIISLNLKFYFVIYEAFHFMITGCCNLTNQKRGDFYGLTATWGLKLKRRLGVYLLHKALKIFLAEGERQIYPTDLH